MKRPLKLGDKVAVYDGGTRKIATVCEIDGVGLGEQGVWVEDTHVSGLWVHYKQCRRLVKKKTHKWTMREISECYRTGISWKDFQAGLFKIAEERNKD